MPSQSAIARDWKVSREYLHQCVKRGCPTTSFQEARLWRESCATSRAPTNPKQMARMLEEEGDDSMKADARRKRVFEDKPHKARLPSIDSLWDTLYAAIEATETTSRLLQEATVEGSDSKIAVLLVMHSKAIKVKLKAETQYREE